MFLLGKNGSSCFKINRICFQGAYAFFGELRYRLNYKRIVNYKAEIKYKI